MRTVRGIILMIVALSSAEPAAAEANASWFIEQIDAGQTANMYILDAYGNGMSWANVWMQGNGQTRLYCPPLKVALTPEQTYDIFKRFVKAHPGMEKIPAGAVLMSALIDAFPCQTS